MQDSLYATTTHQCYFCKSDDPVQFCEFFVFYNDVELCAVCFMSLCRTFARNSNRLVQWIMDYQKTNCYSEC